MKKFIPISLTLLSLSFTTPHSQEGKNDLAIASSDSKPLPYKKWNFGIPVSTRATFIYDAMMLREAGLSEEAFQNAYKGYQYLLAKSKLKNSDYLTICDFSQSSKNKRLYVVDMKNEKLLINTYVAHGRNSGMEYATRFSNKATSRQSSLGFYITSSTYRGSHGLALVINGLEPGFNNNAARRRIVIHGSKYVGANYLELRKFMGRSFGCPAVPQKECTQIINIIKNGSCLFIYHPDKKYQNGSKILNG